MANFMPWCSYPDPELAGIGMNEKGAKEVGLDYRVWTEALPSNDRSLAEAERVGRIKLILDKHEQPLGVQILGPQAGELLSEWVAVLNGKVKLTGPANYGAGWRAFQASTLPPEASFHKERISRRPPVSRSPRRSRD